VDSEALVTHARLDLVQKRHVLLSRATILRGRRDMRNDMKVLYVRELLVERCELMEVRREEAKSVQLGGNVSV
jgi:hypothetical protein